MSKRFRPAVVDLLGTRKLGTRRRRARAVWRRLLVRDLVLVKVHRRKGRRR
jgi:hypothetical protein